MMKISKFEKLNIEHGTENKIEKAEIIDYEPDREWNEKEKQAIEIIKKFQKKDFEAYFAGGAVRDYILNECHGLNKEPDDIDISTSASLEDIEKTFKDNFYYVGKEAKKHGIINIKIGNNIFEVAVFRKDIYNQDNDGITNADNIEISDSHKDGNKTKKEQKHIKGRHADEIQIEKVSAKEDAERRDFTVNGLFFDPIQNKIIDYVGGIEDIKNKTLRFIGDDPEEKIEQDKIRIARFFRFGGDLGFTQEENSLNAIKNWLSNEENRKEFKDLFYLDQRIKPEFQKMIKSEKRIEILENLMENKILELIIPQIAKMKGVEQPKEFHNEGDVWEHTKKCLENLPKNASLELIWAVLLHDTGKPETQETPERDGVDRIHFRGHAKKSAEIAKFILSLEKEPKRYRKMGLNEKGEKIKGFNYTEEFVSRVEWLVKNHMLCKDFSNMKKTKQIEFMKNSNFEDLLEMWRIDGMGSESKINPDPKIGDYDNNLKIYTNFRKEIEDNENNPMFEKQKIITSEEIMNLLREKA